ncbi:MAG: hypothetical protein Q3999_00455 [Buchananella hordeovulneris]|nr:hypothetical protein [Buchananella hordeovulneris]
MKTPRILLALFAGAVLALPACSKPLAGSDSPSSPAPGGAEQSTQAAPEQSQEATAAPGPQESTAQPAAPGDQPQNGQPQPGQPGGGAQPAQPQPEQPQEGLTLASLPASGEPPTAFYGPSTPMAAIISSPSGNICCDIFDGTSVSCMISSWATDMPYGRDKMGRPIIAVFLDADGRLEQGSRGDPPACSGAYGVAPQMLGYGKTVAYGGFLCHSMEVGMACWQPDVKRGFLVNRAGWEELR